MRLVAWTGPESAPLACVLYVTASFIHNVCSQLPDVVSVFSLTAPVVKAENATEKCVYSPFYSKQTPWLMSSTVQCDPID